MANTLTDLIPTIYTALDIVSREQVGFIPAVARNAKADAAAVGQSVTAPVAPPTSLVDITPAAYAPNDGDQTIGNTSVVITKSKMAPVKWNGEEQLALGPAGTYNTILADQFKQAFRALSNAVDADLAALALKAPRAIGTAGTTPFGVAGDLSDIALARKVLSDNGSPTTDLQLVMNTSAAANLRGKQSVLFKVNEAGTEQLLREGVIGRLEGFNLHESAHVAVKGASAASGYLINGTPAVGATAIPVDTGTGTIAAGDTFTIDGDTNTYVVSSATASTITIEQPGLLVAPADGAAVTFGAVAYVGNVAFDRNSFLLAARTPAMPQGGDAADDVMTVTDPVSGISYQVAMYRQYRQVRYEVGLAWGVAAPVARHAVLLMG